MEIFIQASMIVFFLYKSQFYNKRKVIERFYGVYTIIEILSK
jgi:hypothetical protein